MLRQRGLSGTGTTRVSNPAFPASCYRNAARYCPQQHCGLADTVLLQTIAKKLWIPTVG